LGDPGVFQIASLNTGTAVQEGVRYLLLDTQLRENGFEDGGHDGVHITTGEGGSHKWVFQSLHNSGLHTVPGFGAGESLSSHCLGPLGGFLQKEELANLCLQSNRAHDINFLHILFGHCAQDTIPNTSKHYNLQVKARTPLEPCPMCKIANAVQTDVPKQTSTKATKPGGRLFIDSTSVKEIGFGGYKFALGILDDYSGCTFGALLKKKSDQQQVILAFLQGLQAKGITPTNVTIIFCVDSAGENKAL